jgi:L-rhamnose mutarotase
MKRYCLALDLVDDPVLIDGYEQMHSAVWPEIQESIITSGIDAMEIYRFGTRLFMIMEVNDTFSFEKKSVMDQGNEKVQQWEELMWKYQQAVPGAKQGEKWVIMNKIFELTA